uniref:DnaJ homolog subfamily B member 9 n=2 Tax=Lepeophtheirus salmonis TaxID=72036 RepID=D3PI24_LEPSM|nr:DnaJ protein homolog 1 [Lepeophtheirus salmonis]
MGKDFYKILNIRHNSSEIEIKKAYLKLAMKYHPDKNKSEGAEDKFKEISEAYKVLSDKEEKRKYDCGEDGPHSNKNERHSSQNGSHSSENERHHRPNGSHSSQNGREPWNDIRSPFAQFNMIPSLSPMDNFVFLHSHNIIHAHTAAQMHSFFF